MADSRFVYHLVILPPYVEYRQIIYIVLMVREESKVLEGKLSVMQGIAFNQAVALGPVQYITLIFAGSVSLDTESSVKGISTT